jgi:hypothetical protein
MDLFCPHCTSRVTVPNDKAGQVTSCPLCAKQFMAPAMAPPPAAPKPPAPPAPPVETYGMGPPPAPVPSMPSAPSKPAPVLAVAPPSPPLPPGEYTRSFACTLRETWLAFVPTACVVLILVLSFFTWHRIDSEQKPSLWGLSFVDQKVHFMAYTILMLFPILPLTIVALVFDKGFAPPPILPLMPWKSLLVGLLLGFTFLLLLFDYVDAHLFQRINPIALPEKLAIRLHFIAMLASFGMFWLHWRKKSNLPPPKCEVRL